MANGQLRLVLVTPEKTLLDEPANNLRFPLFDGLIGVYPSRAPMVGRLGFGELLIRTPSGELSYYIDGGFVQVRENVVSILTNNATSLEKLNAASLRTELNELVSQTTLKEEDQVAKSDRVDRLRKMLSLAQ